MRTGARGTDGARLTRLPPMVVGCGTPARIPPSIFHLKLPLLLFSFPAISTPHRINSRNQSNAMKTKLGHDFYLEHLSLLDSPFSAISNRHSRELETRSNHHKGRRCHLIDKINGGARPKFRAQTPHPNPHPTPRLPARLSGPHDHSSSRAQRGICCLRSECAFTRRENAQNNSLVRARFQPRQQPWRAAPTSRRSSRRAFAQLHHPTFTSNRE